MSMDRRCDRCRVSVAENAGSVLTVADRATRGHEDFDGSKPQEQHFDLCSICRTDLGQFLGLEE